MENGPAKLAPCDEREDSILAIVWHVAFTTPDEGVGPLVPSALNVKGGSETVPFQTRLQLGPDVAVKLVDAAVASGAGVAADGAEVSDTLDADGVTDAGAESTGAGSGVAAGATTELTGAEVGAACICARTAGRSTNDTLAAVATWGRAPG